MKQEGRRDKRKENKSRDSCYKNMHKGSSKGLLFLRLSFSFLVSIVFSLMVLLSSVTSLRSLQSCIVWSFYTSVLVPFPFPYSFFPLCFLSFIFYSLFSLFPYPFVSFIIFMFLIFLDFPLTLNIKLSIFQLYFYK